MKILIPVHHFLPRYTAGAELYTYRLARWLQHRGHDVEVIAVDAVDQGMPGILSVTCDLYDSIPVRRLSFNQAVGERAWEYNNHLIGTWFADHVAQAQPDLIHFQAGYLLTAAPLAAALASGLPTVVTLHDYWFICPQITLVRGDGSLCQDVPEDPRGCAWCLRLEQRRYRLLEWATSGLFGQLMLRSGGDLGQAHIAARRAYVLPALALADAVIAPSHFLARQVSAVVPSERLHIAQLGLDLAPFAAVCQEDHGGVLRIGYIGQIAPHKGIHLLISAFRSLHSSERQLELHIYGDLNSNIDYTGQLRRLARYDTRIILHGRVENQLVPNLLASLDIVVAPSTWYENAPLAILEAHAAGTPVVVAAMGGMAELVRDGTDGMHFRPGDGRDLARVLQRMIDEPELISQLRGGVRKPRSIDDEGSQLVTIYKHAIDRRVKPAQELM